MLKNLFLLVFNFGVILSIFSSSQLIAQEEQVYKNKCVACHGSQAMGSKQLQAPVIAGLDSSYIKKQLINFKTGIRGVKGPSASTVAMVTIASNLSEEEINTVAEYLSQLPLKPLQQKVEKTGFRGRGLYSGCASCHGANAEGYPGLGAPRLNNQYGWYLMQQLQDFKTGKRGYHENDKLGKQMRSMAEKIQSDEDFTTLVNYIMSR